MRQQASDIPIQVFEETDPRLTIPIKFILRELKWEYQIPMQWSINKVKCLLVSQNARLHFDHFQLIYSGKQLPGLTKINEIAPPELSTLTLLIMTTKSPLTLPHLYSCSIRPLLPKKHQPMMHAEYQKSLRFMESDSIDVEQNLNLNENWEIVEAEVRQLIRILEYLGWTMFIMIVIMKGCCYQIFVIFALIFSHYVIDIFKNLTNQPHPNNPQPNTQPQAHPIPNPTKNPSKNPSYLLKKIKGQLLLRSYKTLQIIFCFLIMLFPNWDLQLYHGFIRGRVQLWREQINVLVPGSYQGEWKVS